MARPQSYRLLTVSVFDRDLEIIATARRYFSRRGVRVSRSATVRWLLRHAEHPKMGAGALNGVESGPTKGRARCHARRSAG